MGMIYIQIIGCGIFLFGSIVLGLLLRKYPSKKFLGKINIISNMLVIFAPFLPFLIGIFYPGLTAYDKLLGIPSLPYRFISVLIGVLMLLMGIFFFALSSLSLLYNSPNQNPDQPAFSLTQQFVFDAVYKYTRNPMSLGFYLGSLGLGLLAGSTYFTLWLLLEFIPCHLFYLKFYEERELEVRFGPPYLEYRKKVPFLIPNFRKSSVVSGSHGPGKPCSCTASGVDHRT